MQALSAIGRISDLVGMAAGVFYRELAKFSGFSGTARLSPIHGHYLSLGLLFFLFLLRGLSEAAGTEMTEALNASIAGVSGIGHIAVAVSMVMILLRVGKRLGQASGVEAPKSSNT